MIDVSLRSFLNTHFQVDAVAHNVHLSRLEIIKDVTVVPIVVTYGILVFGKSLVHVLLIVDVALLHAQRVV